MAGTISTVLTRKGQTTIPAELREATGIKEGDRLIWWIEDGRIHVMGPRRYASNMSERFQAQRDPNQRPLTTEESKAAKKETWTHRHDGVVVEQ